MVPKIICQKLSVSPVKVVLFFMPLPDRAQRHTKIYHLLKILTKMFYHVEIHQMKCFISNCWQNKFSKLSQFFWCQIVWMPNCPFLNSWCQIVLESNCHGAKLSWCLIVLVPNCLGAKLSMFNSWCQIVHF